jgi:pimeloyl-ACP methyl ester carboxylesterase
MPKSDGLGQLCLASTASKEKGETGVTTPSVFRSSAGQQEILALYERLLARWPAPNEQRTVTTRHGNTFVIDSGDPGGTPLVLLHGASANSIVWLGEAAEYGRSHRVCAVDGLGDPGKSAPNRPPMAGPAYVEWLDDVLAALCIERVTLVAISQGGWVGLKYATTRPERVARLALLCPGGVTPPRLSWILRAIPLSLLGSWGAGRLKRIIFGDEPIPPEVDEFMALVQAHFKPRFDPQPGFSDEELRRLDMPVLLLAGARDAVFDSEKTAARLRRCLPRLTAVVLPDAGHVLYNTQQVRAFLADAAG